MSKFKIGDKVKLRDDLEIGKEYGGITFLSKMKSLQNKELIIDNISPQGNYRFEESHYYYSEEMLEKIVYVVDDDIIDDNDIDNVVDDDEKTDDKEIDDVTVNRDDKKIIDDKDVADDIDYKDLLEFALEKLNMTKEELRREHKKNKISEQELEDMKRCCNNFEKYCNGKHCSDCDISEFQKRNDLTGFGLGTKSCILVYEHLFKK